MNRIIKFSAFILIILLSIFNVSFLNAQSKHTIRGHVQDARNGEELLGATVYISEIKSGTITNSYGFYSITLPEGTYNIEFRYLGYDTKKMEVVLNENKELSIELSSELVNLKEATITSERTNENVKSTEMGVHTIDVAKIKQLPVLFGEQDILKTIQLMPGVKSAGEGSSGYHVRGGGADQNLILLDEATVYNASHLLGFFSVFNSDAIKDVKMVKGGMPAEYGGRLSSVLDIRMKEGNMKEYDVSGGIGLIASRLTVEGPIIKDESSFIISGRRTYADLFLPLAPDTQLHDAKLYFYDLNIKANYRFSEKDRLYISGYFGRDVFGYGDQIGIDWGNASGTLRWNHLFSDRLFSNTSIMYSDYNYLIKSSFGEEFKISILSGIKDINFKEDFQYFFNTKHKLKFGLQAIYHTFIPGEVDLGEDFDNIVLDDDYALESAGYIAYEGTLTARLKVNAGLRYSNFMVLGPGDVYSFNPDGTTRDTTTYGDRELIEDYGGLEPRLSLNYTVSETSSLKLGFARNQQYLHLISNATSGTPMDAWIPSSAIVKPGISDQLSLGYFRNFDNNAIETSVEIYYKNLQQQVDYKSGADLLLNPLIESQLVFGDGRAYGVEVYARKNVGRFTGWASYTLAKSERSFDDIDEGQWFPVKHDRTHDVALVGMYELNKKWNLSATWVYNTGDAVTFPSGKYFIDGKLVNYYTERNGYRMPDYHRLDIGATYYFKKTNKRESSLNMSVYNAYGRENAYTITFRQNEDDPNITEAVQLSLFRWIPSISYNFKF